MQDIYHGLINLASENAWVVQVFSIAFLALLCDFLLRLVLQRLRGKLKSTTNLWNDAVISAISGPVRLLVWMVGLIFVVDVVHFETQATIFNAIEPVRQIGVIGAITWFLLRLTRQLQHNFISRNNDADRLVDATTAEAIGKLLRASILIAAGLVALQILASENAWVVRVFSIAFLALLCDFLLRLVLKRLHGKLEATTNIWDDVAVSATSGPVTLLVWIVGLTLAADVVRVETQVTIFNLIEPIRQIGIIGAITWFLLRLTRQLQRNRVSRTDRPVDATTADAIGKLLRASILIVAGLVVLQNLGFSISGILAFGGIGGIAIGFAARDILANFFGGLMIYLDRPFSVGDWVRSPDREIEGTVEYIGWRQTRIRSFDMRPIYVPNGIFSTMAIINPSRMTHRQLHETIGIRYRDADKIEGIIADVAAMLNEHPEIDQSQTTIVNFNRFAPSSLDFFVYTHTRTTQWAKFHEVKQDVLLKINRIITAHGAAIAFPTSTLHVSDPVRVLPRGE